MRRAARVDSTQGPIVAALRSLGAICQSLGQVGDGVPDLLVGWAGRNILLEVKQPAGPDGGASKDGQRLNTEQILWHSRWRGQVAIVRSVDEAIKAVVGRRP